LRTTITKEEIAGLKLEEFEGKIIEVPNDKSVQGAIEYLNQFNVLGFDTESRPSFRKGNTNSIALMQLAAEDVCILFRLNKLGFPKSLLQLLSNPDILKVGISVKDDFQAIRRKTDFFPAGFVDLQRMVTTVGIEDMSLQKIYAILFNKKISKRQRLSNWEANELTELQKKYAALDAWACLKIYNELCLTEKYT